MSKRNIRQLLQAAFGLSLSAGTISAMERRASAALERPYEEVSAAIRGQPVVHMDETRFVQSKERAWLWLAATPQLAVFRIAGSRGGAVAREMIGEDYPGIVISDRYVVYDQWPKRQRQVCWSHLVRNFRRMTLRDEVSVQVGEDLLRCGSIVFGLWRSFARGEIIRSTLANYVRAVRRRMYRALQRGLTAEQGRTRSTCRWLLARFDLLWRFVTTPGVVPDNNHAERQIRHPVIWRRTSGGVDSEAGARYVERVLTTVASLRLQRRDVLAYLQETFTAHLRHDEAPRLVP